MTRNIYIKLLLLRAAYYFSPTHMRMRIVCQNQDSQRKTMAIWLPVVAVCVWSLGIHVMPTDCSHFMGGIIHWRPVDPAAFDGRVRSAISLHNIPS